MLLYILNLTVLSSPVDSRSYLDVNFCFPYMISLAPNLTASQDAQRNALHLNEGLVAPHWCAGSWSKGIAFYYHITNRQP